MTRVPQHVMAEVLGQSAERRRATATVSTDRTTAVGVTTDSRAAGTALIMLHGPQLRFERDAEDVPGPRRPARPGRVWRASASC